MKIPSDDLDVILKEMRLVGFKLDTGENPDGSAWVSVWAPDDHECGEIWLNRGTWRGPEGGKAHWFEDFDHNRCTDLYPTAEEALLALAEAWKQGKLDD